MSTSSDDSSMSSDSDHDDVAAPATPVAYQNSSNEDNDKDEPKQDELAGSPITSPKSDSALESPMDYAQQCFGFFALPCNIQETLQLPGETNPSPKETPHKIDQQYASHESTPSSRGKAPDSPASSRKNSDADDSDIEIKKSGSKQINWEDDLKSSASESEQDKKKKADANALFGGDLSTTDDETESKKSEKNGRELNADDVIGPRLYSEPEEEEEEEAPPPIIDVAMSRTRAQLRGEPFFVKFPNFLSVETKPFEPEMYEDEMEEDDQLDDEGRSRLKLKLENTIRWRYGKDHLGNEVRESNAKIVKWSDGTMSLYLGNEIFDVSTQRVVDHNHLFVRQGAGLQGQAIFRNKLTFRPISTDTLTHKKMTLTMAEKTSKARQVKVVADVGQNPDQEKEKNIKKEEEKLRAAMRREAQQRRVREKARSTGLSSGFLEGYDSGEEGDSLNAIKRGYARGRFEPELIGADSDSDQESVGARRIDEAKIDSDESDYEREVVEKPKQPAKRRIIEDDEEGE